MSSFSANLKVLRKKHGVMQTGVAEVLGVKPRAVRFYEAGEREPNINSIVKLCQYFNVSADYLLGLTDEPRPLNGSQQTNDLRSIEMLPSTSPKQISFVITVPVNSSLVASEN